MAAFISPILGGLVGLAIGKKKGKASINSTSGFGAIAKKEPEPAPAPAPEAAKPMPVADDQKTLLEKRRKVARRTAAGSGRVNTILSEGNRDKFGA